MEKGLFKDKILDFYKGPKKRGDAKDPLIPALMKTNVEQLDSKVAIQAFVEKIATILLNPFSAIPFNVSPNLIIHRDRFHPREDLLKETDGGEPQDFGSYDFKNEYPFDYFDTCLFLLYEGFYGKAKEFPFEFIREFLIRNQLFDDVLILENWEDKIREFLVRYYLFDQTERIPLDTHQYNRMNEFRFVNRAYRKLKEIILQSRVCSEIELVQEYKKSFLEKSIHKKNDHGVLSLFPELKTYQNQTRDTMRLRVYFLFDCLNPRYSATNSSIEANLKPKFPNITSGTADELFTIFFPQIYRILYENGKNVSVEFPMGFDPKISLYESRSYRRNMMSRKFLKEDSTSLIHTELKKLMKQHHVDEARVIKILKMMKRK